MEAERRPGARVANKWWEHPRLRLAGAAGGIGDGGEKGIDGDETD